MAGKIAPAKVGQGHRNHQRKLAPERLLGFERGHDRRLGIQRVEDGFDEDEVDAAVDERVDLFAIDRLDLVEIDLAEAGIVDVRRQRQRFVGRPERAGDPANLAVPGRVAVSNPAHDFG